jgi:hypothetical protein
MAPRPSFNDNSAPSGTSIRTWARNMARTGP